MHYIKPIADFLMGLARRNKGLVTTGELMVIDHGVAPDKSGRRYLCVYGIIAVPTGCNLKNLHMYPVLGDRDGLLILDVAEARDETKTAGMGVQGHLTSVGWRI